MATFDPMNDFYERMRESAPDVFKAYLWCRLIPHLHEEYPCTNTKTGQHPKKHYSDWILKYQDLFSAISSTHYINKRNYYKPETLHRIQQSYARAISQSRLLDHDFDFSKFFVWKTQLNIPTDKVWDFEDLDKALDVKLKLHSGDIEKCEKLREAHERLCQYVQYNIDFMDEHILKLDKEKASEAWLEAYADLKNREKENENDTDEE